MSANSSNEMIQNESSLSLFTFVGFLLAVGLGVFGAVVLLPFLAPALSQSLFGANPKAYWYLSRGSAIVALCLLWVSMALGLLITNKMSRLWPGAPAAFAIHEYVSLLGIAFAMFHALILMGDHYINYSLGQILMPFGSANYKPLVVGVGQIGFYVWLIISASFYVRQYIGSKLWKLIHFASFFTFVVALAHGLLSGTDSSLPWMQNLYWFLGSSLLFLLFYRLISTLFPIRPPVPQPRPNPPQSAR